MTSRLRQLVTVFLVGLMIACELPLNPKRTTASQPDAATYLRTQTLAVIARNFPGRSLNAKATAGFWGNVLTQPSMVPDVELFYEGPLGELLDPNAKWPLYRLPDNQLAYVKYGDDSNDDRALRSLLAYLIGRELRYVDIHPAQIRVTNGRVQLISNRVDGISIQDELGLNQAADFAALLDTTSTGSRSPSWYAELADRYGKSFVDADVFRVFALCEIDSSNSDAFIRSDSSRITLVDTGFAFESNNMDELIRYLKVHAQVMRNASSPLIQRILTLTDEAIDRGVETAMGSVVIARLENSDSHGGRAHLTHISTYSESLRKQVTNEIKRRRNAFREVFAMPGEQFPYSKPSYKPRMRIQMHDVMQEFSGMIFAYIVAVAYLGFASITLIDGVPGYEPWPLMLATLYFLVLQSVVLRHEWLKVTGREDRAHETTWPWLTRLTGRWIMFASMGRAVQTQPGHKVLELGAANWTSLRLAREFVPRARYIGLDIIFQGLRRNQRHPDRSMLKATTNFLQADATALPFSRAAFDRVFMINPIFLWNAGLLEGIHRVLKDDGVLAIGGDSHDDRRIVELAMEYGFEWIAKTRHWYLLAYVIPCRGTLFHFRKQRYFGIPDAADQPRQAKAAA